MKLPKRIFIIALLFCLGGLFAIYSIVEGLFNDHLNVNLSIFMLPVGIGLFKGKASSRWWARFWIILGYILWGAMMILSAVKPSWTQAAWFGRKLEGSEALPYVWAVSLASFAILILLHKLLYSAKSEAYFSREPSQAGVTDSDMESDRNLRRENAMDHKLYKEFMLSSPEVDGLPSKEKHELFRQWKTAKGVPD